MVFTDIDNHAPASHFNTANVYFNLICENKNPVEISESTVNKTIDSLHTGQFFIIDLGNQFKCVLGA